MSRIRSALAGALLSIVPGCACLTPVIKAHSNQCNDFQGPIASCTQACIRPFTGRVAGPLTLGEQGKRFADLLHTAWHTEPHSIRPYDVDHPATGSCNWPGAGQAYYCALDDSISYDVKLLNTLDRFAGDMAAVVVIAHEWGHVNQARMGLLDQEELTPVEKELHADCQAGAFAAMLQAWGELSRDDISDAFFALCHFADDEGYFSAVGHGDCEVRRNAFMYGYRTAQFQIDDMCGKDPASAVVSMCTY